MDAVNQSARSLHDDLVVSLDGVEFCDSSALGVFVGCHRRLGTAGPVEVDEADAAGVQQHLGGPEVVVRADDRVRRYGRRW